MFTKDASISRHPGWDEYKAQSGMLIPWRLITGRALFDLFGEKDTQQMNVDQKNET